MIYYPNGVTVENIMADGSVCDDLSTYLKSADQLPDLTKSLIARFVREGMKIDAKTHKDEANQGRRFREKDI